MWNYTSIFSLNNEHSLPNKESRHDQSIYKSIIRIDDIFFLKKINFMPIFHKFQTVITKLLVIKVIVIFDTRKTGAS